MLRPIVMSEIAREVRKDKDSSEVRSSKTRLSRLTTSKETKVSLSDIVKF